jgi:hypothetical protein
MRTPTECSVRCASRSDGVAIVHPLRVLLDDAAAGGFPPVDGLVEMYAPMHPGHAAVVEFTGHAVILTEHDLDDLLALGADGFGGASHPDVKRQLAGSHGSIGTHDAMLVAPGRGGDRTTSPLSVRTDMEDHPRVVRARAHRRDVTIYGDESGLVTLGRGLVDRLEMSVELFADQTHGQGAGRRLVAAGLDLVPAGEHVWAQVAPGNAASLRAFLACGFVPVGAETLILTHQES